MSSSSEDRREKQLTARLLPLILGSSLLSAGLTQVFAYVHSRQEKHRDAEYAAVRIAVTLEDFATSVHEAWRPHDFHNFRDRLRYQAESQMSASQKQHVDKYGHIIFNLSLDGVPELSAYPLDINWRSLAAVDISDSLSFQGTVQHVHTYLLGKYSIDGRAEDAYHLAPLLAARAEAISSRLRKEYQLPARDIINPEKIISDIWISSAHWQPNGVTSTENK